jgi:hypothetical protein
VKFGIFLPNGSNGYIISRASPQYSPTFEHNKAIAIEAERQGFHMILSMMKYRGFGQQQRRELRTPFGRPLANAGARSWRVHEHSDDLRFL